MRICPRLIVLHVTVVLASILLASLLFAQEPPDNTKSVLVNPPAPQVQQAPPVVQIPQVTYVLRRGFFGAWRVEPVVPVQFVVVRPAPRPVVVWTPWVVWR
jgi:hypothetical protein